MVFFITTQVPKIVYTQLKEVAVASLAVTRLHFPLAVPFYWCVAASPGRHSRNEQRNTNVIVVVVVAVDIKPPRRKTAEGSRPQALIYTL